MELISLPSNTVEALLQFLTVVIKGTKQLSCLDNILSNKEDAASKTCLSTYVKSLAKAVTCKHGKDFACDKCSAVTDRACIAVVLATPQVPGHLLIKSLHPSIRGSESVGEVGYWINKKRKRSEVVLLVDVAHTSAMVVVKAVVVLVA